MCVLLKQVLWDGYYAYYYKNTANYSYLKVCKSGLLTCKPLSLLLLAYYYKNVYILQITVILKVRESGLLTCKPLSLLLLAYYYKNIYFKLQEF